MNLKQDKNLWYLYSMFIHITHYWKLQKKILKVLREKWHIICRRTIIRMTVDFSSKTTKTRRKHNNILKALEEKVCQPRIWYLMKISFKNKSEIKTFSGKVKLKEFIASRPAIKEFLIKVIQKERQWNKSKLETSLIKKKHQK